METEQDKKILFSGIQPSGCITIGNYIGAIKNWLKLQKTFDCYFSIVDMHAITVRQNPAELRKRTLDFLAQYLACGLSPEESTIFIQSHVHEHAELTWVLNCCTYLGELSRMTQFKDKSKKHEENINAGLLDYPVLMAADILLYQTALVPVGIDQKQHLELSRDIAARFNGIYGETFTVPEPYIPEAGAKIKSLQDPSAKMSKSDSNENASVSIIDPPEVILRKFKRAVTDSDNKIKYTGESSGISNLLTIYSAFADTSVENAEKEFEGTGYGDFKIRVAEAVIEKLSPVQNEYKKLISDKGYLENIYKEGAIKAQYKARKTLSKVYRKIGFVQK